MLFCSFVPVIDLTLMIAFCLLMETFAQVITSFYDAILGAVKCEVLNSVAFVPLDFEFFSISFRIEIVYISSFRCSIVFS